MQSLAVDPRSCAEVVVAFWADEALMHEGLRQNGPFRLLVAFEFSSNNSIIYDTTQSDVYRMS